MGSTYGYADGFLSNSMLQAKSFCQTYYDLRFTQQKNDSVLNGIPLRTKTLAGSVVHKLIENNTLSFEGVLNMCETFGLDLPPRARIQSFQTAVDEVLSDRPTLSAPTMSRAMTGKTWFDSNSLLPVPQCTWEEFFEVVFCSLFQIRYRRWDFSKYQHEIEFQRDGYIGKLDLWCPGNGADLPIIGDVKTGLSKWTVDKLHNSDQFRMYLELSGEQSILLQLYDVRRGQLLETVLNTTDPEHTYFLARRKARTISPGPLVAASRSVGCPCVFAFTGDCPYYMEGLKDG